jgi:hypothetical protein
MRWSGRNRSLPRSRRPRPYGCRRRYRRWARVELLDGESGDQLDVAGFGVFAQHGAEGAAGGHRVRGLAAVGVRRTGRPDGLGDVCVGRLGGEVGEQQQRVGGGVSRANDEDPLAGEPVAIGAEDVGRAYAQVTAR